MDQCEEVSSDATGLGGDDSLGGGGGNGGVYRVATLPEDALGRLGREVVGGGYCGGQETLSSGRKRLRASSTARTTALDSSSST